MENLRKEQHVICQNHYHHYLMKKLSLMFLLLFISGKLLFAQTSSISGTVVSTKNEPLIGATVVVQGTTNGTITNLDGTFKMNIPAKTTKLVISSIGFKTKVIDVAGQSVFNITMEEDIQSLEGVVVVGYGSVKKSDITGSVSSVKAESFSKQPVTQISQALQGRASGVMVQTTSGAPGADAKIRIRGLNSLFGNNNPLYIVDGMATDPAGLNTNDIASFEVLKDASATAIYGNRGANGVILITTKKGKAGKALVEASTTYGFDLIPEKRLLPTLNAVDYMNLTNEIVKPGSYSPEEVAAFEASGKSTNWQKVLYGTGATQNYQLAVSGGNENARYYLGGGYITQDGIAMNTNYKQYSLRSNIDAKLGKKISLTFNNNISNKDVHNGAPANLQEALAWSPTLPVKDSIGNYTPQDIIGHKEGRNPIASINDQDDNWATFYIHSNLEMNFEILPGLNFKPLVGFEQTKFESKYFHGKGYTGALGEAGISNSSSTSFQNSNVLTYNKTFNDKHNLSVTAVNEWIVNKSFDYGMSESGIPNNYFGYYKMGTGAVQNLPYSGYGKSQLLSFLGRVNYSYASKYLLTASYRADASSKFRGDNKWGFFPSAALSWKASEEDFIKNLGIFHNLKLRLSYGVTGSQAINSYQTQSIMGSDPTQFGYPYASSILNRGYGLGSIANANLRWETTSTINAGIDFGFFEGRLNLNVDVFQKNTTDMLYPKSIPEFQGGGTIMTNVGDNRNSGIEANIDAVIVKVKDFTWTTSLNGSFIKSKITALADTILTGPQYWGAITIHRTQVGQPASSFYVLQADGVWTDAQKDEAAVYGKVPGDVKYVDQNQDSTINANDYTFAGSPYPDFYWGWTNEFSYKNFDLSVFITGSMGAKLFNQNYLLMNTSTIWSATLTHPDAQNYYDPTLRPDSDIPSVIGTEAYESSRFLQDASFIRIKNISLSYTYGKYLFGFTSLKFMASVQNAAVFTKYKGYDPESIGYSVDGKDVYTGFDAGLYPTAQTFTFGIKATF